MTESLPMSDAIPLTEVPGAKLYCGDALDVLRSLPSNSIDLIATDPPYFRVKGLAWDRAWDTRDGFIAWIGQLADEWCRVLKPNGSLYCFASPRMAARVEVEIGRRFEINNNIVWNKMADYAPGDHRATAYRARDTGSFRKFFDYSERIVFAGQIGANNITPLGSSIAVARIKANMRATDIDVALGYVRRKDPMRGTELCRRWEEGSSIPSVADYARALAACGDQRSTEELQREYENLRRPFAVTADVPYTDVWDFKTVPHRPGKHVCEKPLDLCEHIILASSRPGAVVLDSFCGSGAFGHAAVKHGRTFIGSDNDPHWIAKSAQRIAAVTAIPPPPPQPSMFPDAVQKTAPKAPQQRGFLLPESPAPCR